MKTPNPTAWATKWNTGMQNAGPAYIAGVQSTQVSPTQLAANAADLWASNVAASKPRFIASLNKITNASWQQSTVTKGAPRLADGAAAALPKVQTFMAAFAPALQNVVQNAPARGTYSQNKARANAVMDGLHALKGTF